MQGVAFGVKIERDELTQGLQSVVSSINGGGVDYSVTAGHS